MKFAGYACVGAFAVALAALGLQQPPERARAEPRVSLEATEPVAVDALSAGAVAGEPVAALSTDDSPEEPRTGPGPDVGQAAPSQETRADDDRRERDRRDRRRRWWEEDVSGDPADWEPPEGPVRVALQAGHWRADEAPRELSGLRGNGTRWGNVLEWQVNLAIAKRAGAMLEQMGYEVDILPAVVPPRYRAHLFVSIHADGSNDSRATGYRVAAPRRDYTGRASGMVSILEEAYGEATGLPRIPTVTRRMRNYYAFNSRRYEHALHPMTIAVIIETGFLTSASDRRIILNAPERAARGIVRAVTSFPETPPPTMADPEPPGS